MAARKSIWGPELDQYSRGKFDPHISDIANEEIEGPPGKYGVPPLASIENSLCMADPRTAYPPGFSGIIHLRMMTDTVRKYLLVNKNKAMAFRALDRAGDTAINTESLVDYCNALINIIPGQSLGEVDALGLARLIWEDRGSFSTLSSRGLLPGCTLLLLAALKQLSTHSDKDRYLTDVYYLQDLGFRLYLVGSRRDQQVLVPVCLFATVKDAETPRGINIFISPEDSHAIARAYSGLLHVWKQYGSGPKLTPASLVGHLANFVANMTMLNPSATTQEYIDITSTSFRYLWLHFEHKDQIPVEQHAHTRGYTMTHLTTLRLLQQRKISTQEDKHKFVQMLADIEIISLIGRVLLLITEEGSDIQNTEPLAMTLIPLSEFKDVLDFSVSIAPELLRDSKIEWAKILAHLRFLITMGMVKRKGKSDSATHYLSSVLNSWTQYASSLQDRRPVLQDHWQLSTSDSHKLVCDQSGGDDGDEDEDEEE
ncbi:hypothetical protein FRC06_008724 [Ceratobasidium sp. 370]|nr:hypothetical protein FRC06_008724 [Ceratobasidium sp. 370]